MFSGKALKVVVCTLGRSTQMVGWRPRLKITTTIWVRQRLIKEVVITSSQEAQLLWTKYTESRYVVVGAECPSAKYSGF